MKKNTLDEKLLNLHKQMEHYFAEKFVVIELSFIIYCYLLNLLTLIS